MKILHALKGGGARGKKSWSGVVDVERVSQY